jgi:hypothetical protein
VGIITGDISCNTSASVLIMTTEILLNKLYQLKSGKTEIVLNKEKSGGTTIKNPSSSFDMDIYGGEPTLHPNFNEILEHLSNNKFCRTSRRCGGGVLVVI